MKPISEILDKSYESKVAKIRGWVAKKRTLKDRIFLVIRDSSGFIQTIVKSGTTPWKEAKKVTTESSIELSGKIRKDVRAPGGYELDVIKLDIVGLAEEWPIARDTSPDFLLDIRHLSIRRKRLQTILKIRSAVFDAYHEYFKSQGYYSHQSPIFTPTPGESGSETFEVKYFKKKAFLTQTWQLYAEAMLPVLEKIYTIAPTFRAEKSLTARHLTEFWMAEVETAWQQFPQMLDQIEDMVRFICKQVATKHKSDIEYLGQDPEYFAKLPKFPRITYKEAISELQKDGFKIKFGDDLGTKEEKYLVAKRKIPLFVTHYPEKIKAFYIKRDPKDPKLVLASDLIFPGIGEVVGSAERSTDFEDIKKRLKAAGEDPKLYEWYLDVVSRYGAVPHSGFGMGTERLIMWLTGSESVKDCIAFPRTPRRIHP